MISDDHEADSSVPETNNEDLSIDNTKYIHKRYRTLSRDRRTFFHIAVFVNGFASGWKIALPESFKDALDIKLTEVVRNKITKLMWTQGNLFSFQKGDTFYDNKAAYNNIWEIALNKIKIAIQIESAKAVSYVTSGKIETIDEPNTTIKITTSSSSKKEINKITIYKDRLDKGYVKFNVLHPNKNKDSLKFYSTYECTQYDFVALLQTGIFYTSKGNKVNIFDFID